MGNNLNNSIKAAYIFTTGVGVGYFPAAPGTAASLLAAIIYWILPVGDFFLLIISIVLFFPGVYFSTIIEKQEGKDPGIIVIDEFLGQWMTYILLPKTVTFLILGFIIFRIFDISKPFPANISEKLPGGWGIMLDDVVAAIYANICLQLIYYIIKI